MRIMRSKPINSISRRKKVVPSWTQDAIESNNQARNPRIQTATTTLDANMQSSKTITYNTNFNVTQEQTRDWGSGAPGDLVFQRDVTYTLIASPSFERPQVETISAKNPEDPQQTFMLQGKRSSFTISIRSHPAPERPITTGIPRKWDGAI